VAAVKKVCEVALSEGRVSLRTIASIQGNFAWAIPAIPFAQSHYRSLQRFYILFSMCSGLTLTWKPKIVYRQAPHWTSVGGQYRKGERENYFQRDPVLEIFSDASLTGWGAVCNGVTTRGLWTLPDLNKRINELELLGTFFAIQTFSTTALNTAIRIFLDNSTAVSYVNKCGGTKSAALTTTTKAISAWCEDRSISVEAVNVGELNVIADRESRAEADTSDWRLDSAIFSRISEKWNSQLSRFIAWGPQPGAVATNALSVC
jgi:hypothetical protein